MKHPRIAIVGAGPAGLSAAMQLTRQGQSPLLLEGDRPGGLLENAHWVENYPGFPEGISGPALVDEFLAQAKRIGVRITPAWVEYIEFSRDEFNVETDQGRFLADILIVASGTEAKPYQDVSIPAEASSQVLYEVASLHEERDKQFLIIGAGDAALDYALNLGRQNHVSLLNRSHHVKGLSLLWKRVKQQPAIDCYHASRIINIQSSPDGKLLIETKRRKFSCDYLIPAIGRRPALDFMGDQLLEEVESLSAQGKLFLIGDVKNGPFRQTAIAVGDGLKAAMAIEQNLHGGS